MQTQGISEMGENTYHSTNASFLELRRDPYLLGTDTSNEARNVFLTKLDAICPVNDQHRLFISGFLTALFNKNPGLISKKIRGLEFLVLFTTEDNINHALNPRNFRIKRRFDGTYYTVSNRQGVRRRGRREPPRSYVVGKDDGIQKLLQDTEQVMEKLSWADQAEMEDASAPQ